MILDTRPQSPSATELSNTVRTNLDRVADTLRMQDVPVPELRGKLLRPALAYALVPAGRREHLDDRFWLGALAIQMVHEASLLHDDVIDAAKERRGGPTVFASRGVGAAVVLGDHYLTGAYRAAAAARLPVFFEQFIVAVERTVAGEKLQGSKVGERIDLRTYYRAITDKSGQLLGACACLAACAAESGREHEMARLGRRIGALYQQIDDLLDYCVDAGTGKEALKDYRLRKWTWVLDVAGVTHFERGEAELVRALFGRDETGASPAERAIVFLEGRRRALVARARSLDVTTDVLEQLLDGWLQTAREGVTREVDAVGRAALRPSAPPTAEASAVEAAEAPGGHAAGRPTSRSTRSRSA